MLFKTGKCADEVLPPNGDCLNQHIKRASFQAAAWDRCLSPQLQLPPAVGSGWQLKSDGQLEIVWMTHPPALIELVHCKCRLSGCLTQRCSCLKSGLKCTNICCCIDCQNGQQENNNESSNANEESESATVGDDDDDDDETDDDYDNDEFFCI